MWNRLGTDLKPRHLEQVMTLTLKLDKFPVVFEEHIEEMVTGGTVVELEG